MTGRVLLLVFLLLTPAVGELRADPAEEAYEQNAEHGAHMMDTAVMDELRSKVASYRDKPDSYLAQSMVRMGPNYVWYISGNSVSGGTGVLVLAHSAGVEGDRRLVSSVNPVADEQPAAIAFGMAMMTSGHIQKAIDDLIANGAERIAVVPVVVTSHNALARQWEYIFGLRDEAAYATIARVNSSVPVRVVPPIAAHPIVTEILLDHLRDISTDPANEVAFIVGHGPTDLAENEEELAIQRLHADKIKSEMGFADAIAFNVQDDAPDEIRAAIVERLRGMVEAAIEDGKKPLVVPFLMMTGRVQAKFSEDLAGLGFAFKNAGLSANPRFSQWIAQSIEEEFGLEEAGASASSPD